MPNSLNHDMLNERYEDTHKAYSQQVASLVNLLRRSDELKKLLVGKDQFAKKQLSCESKTLEIYLDRRRRVILSFSGD